MRLAVGNALLFLCLLCAPIEAAQPLGQSPHVVFVLVDDLGWSDLACSGHDYHRTPHIDQLARDGMRFTNGYSPAPICSAARASMLTGKTVARLGFEFVTKNDPGRQQLDVDTPLSTPTFTLNLPLAEQTMAERLGELGYETAFFGKWHLNQHFERKYLAWHPEFGPRQQGFDVAGEDFGDHPYAWVRKRKPADAPEGEFPADSMFEQANEFIRRRHERPFFLMVSTFYVHTPVKNRCRWLVNEYETLVPANARSRPRRLEYAAFVETLDHHVGSLLQTIDQAGLRNNTLVVFMSDNGGHPEYCSNAPLRGSKWNLYEGGIRVPVIARWPAKIKAGMVCDAPVIGYDLLPTFAELAGGSAEQLDGRSMADLFADPQARREPRALLWHFPYYHPESTFSKAQDRIGVADFAMSKTRPHSAIREGDYKLLKFAEDQRVELFNLAADLSESRDLSQQSPEIAARLDRKLESMLTDMKARRATKRKSSD